MVRPPLSASSASVAHAALTVGCAAATSAAGVPAASAASASGAAGSSVAGGPPSRLMPLISAALGLAGGQQVLARGHHAGGHAGLGGLEVAAGVVGLLVADLAVDLQDAVVLAEHVAGDRAGEGVLGVGVDVHLHHAVG